MLKAKIKGVFSTGHTDAMVTYSVTKMITTCISIIGWFAGSMTVASTDEECL